MFIGRCKASSEEILNSISGISWVDAQKERMTVIQEHIDYLNKSIESVKKTIDVLVKPYECYINFLCTIPGVDRHSAISIKISRAGIYLKPALVEVAHCAVTDKKCDYYAVKYKQLSKRRGKKRAIIAIARKILVAVYHMLSTGEVFNPSDLSKVETTDKDKIKYTKSNFLQSTKQLLSLGITEEEILLLINSKTVNSTPIT